MKFQSIALMIHYTFKSSKTIKSLTACFTVRIITGCRGFYSFLKVC